jgi:hypothetical protein
LDDEPNLTCENSTCHSVPGDDRYRTDLGVGGSNPTRRAT